MRSGSCQTSSYCGRVMGMTICLAPRGGCVGAGFRSRSTRRVFGRASIFGSSSVVRRRMTKMTPAGYPAPQYLQSGRVSKIEGTAHTIIILPIHDLSDRRSQGKLIAALYRENIMSYG